MGGRLEVVDKKVMVVLDLLLMCAVNGLGLNKKIEEENFYAFYGKELYSLLGIVEGRSACKSRWIRGSVGSAKMKGKSLLRALKEEKKIEREL